MNLDPSLAKMSATCHLIGRYLELKLAELEYMQWIYYFEDVSRTKHCQLIFSPSYTILLHLQPIDIKLLHLSYHITMLSKQLIYKAAPKKAAPALRKTAPQKASEKKTDGNMATTASEPVQPTSTSDNVNGPPIAEFMAPPLALNNEVVSVISLIHHN